MNRLILTALALASLGLVSAGCALFSSENTHPVIRESPFNWLEIDYLQGHGKSPVRLSLLGMGNIRMKRGVSPLVKDDFAHDAANIHWNDIQTDQINLDPADLRSLFQAFVDRGVLDKPNPDFPTSTGCPVARIRGALNGDSFERVAAEPELTGYVAELIQLFDQTRLGGAREPVVHPR
jgi:hypothetical protein